MKNTIYPCLWMDGKAHEAADFYCGVFPNSHIVSKNPIVAVFELNGNRFMTMNGGPEYKINEGVSFVVSCETQGEIDYYWDKLTAGGQEGKCGWLTDKYGVSWQIVPSILGALMNDAEKAPKVMYAFMQMKKFDLEKLKQV